MKIEEIKKLTSMPASSPVAGQDKFRCINREFFIVDYETDVELLRAAVPEPLELDLDNGPIAKFEVIKMADFRGFGDFTESGIVIPVKYNGKKGGFVYQMYLDNFPAIAGGREIWGFPKKYGKPTLFCDSDTLVGQLKFGSLEVARATMPYKSKGLDLNAVKKALEETPGFLLKIIPDVDNTPKICELVEYGIEDVVVKEAYTGVAGLELFDHALAPMAKLPVKKVIKATHIITDLTLGWGEVKFDYLKK
jgi:acetoacetate decarboxylase